MHPCMSLITWRLIILKRIILVRGSNACSVVALSALSFVRIRLRSKLFDKPRRFEVTFSCITGPSKFPRFILCSKRLSSFVLCSYFAESKFLLTLASPLRTALYFFVKSPVSPSQSKSTSLFSSPSSDESPSVSSALPFSFNSCTSNSTSSNWPLSPSCHEVSISNVPLCNVDGRPRTCTNNYSILRQSVIVLKMFVYMYTMDIETMKNNSSKIKSFKERYANMHEGRW